MSEAKQMPDLGWALVKPTLGSTEYMPVKVVRKTKRFAYVLTPSGKEWRYSARGFWDGFATEEAAYAELQKMRRDAAEYLKAKRAALSKGA